MRNLEEMGEQFSILKKEVDALQISVMSSKTPWYKNFPIIISVLALLFSFGTTYVSNQRIEAQDIQALKSELRGMLQQLATLPSKNFEMTKKYSNDPNAIAFIGGQLNQENSLLAYQAADLVMKLPSDRVTAIEIYSVAVALQLSYEVQKAFEMYQLSYEIAEDLNTAVSAKRGIANALYLLGQPEAGRVQYQEALNIFSRYSNYNDFTQKTTHVATFLNWASAEANAGYIAKARQKLDEARGIVESLPEGQYTSQLAGQVQQGYNMLSGTNN